jgi:hypothetical protein
MTQIHADEGWKITSGNAIHLRDPKTVTIPEGFYLRPSAPSAVSTSFLEFSEEPPREAVP